MSGWRAPRPSRRTRLTLVLGAGALLAAGCSPRAASSEPGATPTTSPPTISFEALGQTTTTAPPTTVPPPSAGTKARAVDPNATTAAVTTGPSADPNAVTAAASAGDPTAAAGATARASESSVPVSFIDPPSTAPPPPPPLAIGERRADGTVPVVVEPTVTRFAVLYRDNDGDPYYQVRTTPEVGFLFDVELYTRSGAGWTGQLGDFATDCELNGICVYLRLAPADDSHDADPVAMIADPLGQVTISRLTGGVQLHLRQLRFRALGSGEVYALDDLQLDLVPPA
jgi:hypothetical protein